MIKQLRKRHLQIWILWAILLPIGIIVAWIAVPRKVTQELLKEARLKSSYDTIATVEKENYRINILFDLAKKTSSLNVQQDSLTTGFYVEYINKKEINTPPLLLYKMVDFTTNDVDKQELLGRVQAGVSQFFPFFIDCSLLGSEKSCGGKFVLYDIVKKQIIDTVSFKTPFQKILL